MSNLDWLTDALGDFEDDYVSFGFGFGSSNLNGAAERLADILRARTFLARNRLSRTNRTYFPYPRPSKPHQAAHWNNEHPARVCVLARISVYGGHVEIL